MSDARAFIARWSAAGGAEHANAQQFFLELCDLLGVDRPNPHVDAAPDYRFEKQVEIQHEDGHVSTDRVDFYKRGHFVIEAKQGVNCDFPGAGLKRESNAWKKVMQAAFGQALKYASYLPEGKPPFLITCDVGYVFEVWTGFSGDYGGYGARRTLHLADLVDPAVRETLVAIFTDPLSLDPSRKAAKVTCEVASHLADLARALEGDGHGPERVARFLMRCLFTMFAEDVGLLPPDLFTRAIREDWLPDPASFPRGIELLWTTMNHGGPFGTKMLRRFNGGLFQGVDALPLTRAQLQQLLNAAVFDWSCVEPAIFGTLVERALDPDERHELGAHFTPREYIERLVRPTVIDPLRADWNVVQAEVRQVLGDVDREPTPADRKKAVRLLKDFLNDLCRVRVLDPACGSGNFLYVTFDLLKEVEAEVLRELHDLGESQQGLELEGVRVTPQQFLGLERNPRAREIADLVLWLGYLQWWRRTHGDVPPQEPILQQYDNIRRQDAVLAYDDEHLRLDGHGKPVSVWNQRTKKLDPITGKQVPDEQARVGITDYGNARQAEWPEADFIVSNPPFLGNHRMREALGDGYTEALRAAYPGVPQSVDLVMFWWEKAALLVRAGQVRRFGLITTNSITQSFNRRVVETHLKADKDPLAVAWAIADHPWVIDGAAVRIAMTVGCRVADLNQKPTLGRVVRERNPDNAPEGGARWVDVELHGVPRINADLSGGADVTGVVALRANDGLSCPGVKLHGAGFIVTPDEARALGLGSRPGLGNHIRPYRHGKDLADRPRGVLAIDLFGLAQETVRERFPEVFQWVLERVKPEREQNKRAVRRLNWWIFGEPVSTLRAALKGLRRYISTPETAKHRWFTFLDEAVLPDNMLTNIAADDAWVIGVLSSRAHVAWSLAAGGRMGIGNDPRYNKTRCFDPFPFPAATELQKARIRELGEALDAHRKQVQTDRPDVTMTAMYNALERARDADAGGPPLTGKERDFHARALIGLLKTLHDDLDAAVADAYGWPVDLPDDEILTRLVALNAQRAQEEAQGQVRWLRPDFQKPRAGVVVVEQALDGMDVDKAVAAQLWPWPKSIYDQIRAVRDFAKLNAGTHTAGQIAAAFQGASQAVIRRHLEALEDLGVLVAYDDDQKRRRWHARLA